MNWLNKLLRMIGSRHTLNWIAGVLMVSCASLSVRSQPVITSARFDAEGRFVVQGSFPSGHNYTGLEFLAGPPKAPWRTMLSSALDGRAGTVTFRLPPPVGIPAGMVRFMVGPGQPPANPELTDPALVTVDYQSSAGELPEQLKLDNLASLMRKYAEWSSLTREQRNTNLIAHALTLPNVVKAGYSELAGTVFLIYTDGDASVIFDNRRAELGLKQVTPVFTPPVPIGRTAKAVERAGELRALVNPRERLPQSINAVCAFSLENGVFSNAAPAIAEALSAAGYSVTTYSSTTVQDILGWQNLGVLFWQTHAGSLGGGNTGIPESMCLETGEIATKEKSQGPYKSMRSGPQRELYLGAVPDRANPQNTNGLPVYALTPVFIQNRMSGTFAENSLFALDACTGAHSDLATPLLNHKVGALVSWDWLSGTESCVRFRQFFDRLLGRNLVDPISTPKERPFALRPTQWWMQDQGYDIDPSPKYPNQQRENAQLIWRYHPTTPALALLPSIFRILYEARDQTNDFTKFLIEGSFGEDPGPANRLVSWGNTILQVLDWNEPGGIRVRLPAPPLPQGDIQVSVGNRRSNRVPMTEWTIPFHYRLAGKGSLEYTIDLIVRLRADVRGFRTLPGIAPTGGIVPMWTLADCTGTVSASGLYKPDPNTTVTWSGGSLLRSSDMSSSTSPQGIGQIQAQGLVSLNASTIQNFMLSALGTFTETVDGDGSEMTAWFDGFLFPPLSLSFEPVTFTIPGRTLTSQLSLSTHYAVSATLTWGTVVAVAVPNLDTPR
jgi:hypothetical protein